MSAGYEALATKARAMYGRRLHAADLERISRMETIGAVLAELRQSPAWAPAAQALPEDQVLTRARLEDALRSQVRQEELRLMAFVPQGDRALREAIVEYLATYRGVVCDSEQMVVGAGVEYLLGLAAHLLNGGTAAIENPGYRRVRTILENSDLPCRGVSIDEGGLSVSALEESGANLCCVTPSHHFPTGVTMPAGRRSQLLRWATAQQGRYIIEDDYDAEFRFDIRPLPSLQGLGGQSGPVIYLSTFSKSLAPSIRIACMVLPPELLERYRSTYGTYANTVSRFEQQTLCRFLRDGYFTRHLSRMRSAYKARMEALCAALEHTFGRERLTLQGRHNGLHLLLTLRDGPGEGAMVRRAMEEGVKLTGLSTYYLEGAEGCPESTVVLGYAGLADDDIPDLAAALGRAWGT